MLGKKAKKRVIENNDYPDYDDNVLSSAKKRHRVNNLDNFLDDDENDSDDDDPNISLSKLYICNKFHFYRFLSNNLKCCLQFYF